MPANRDGRPSVGELREIWATDPYMPALLDLLVAADVWERVDNFEPGALIRRGEVVAALTRLRSLILTGGE